MRTEGKPQEKPVGLWRVGTEQPMFLISPHTYANSTLGTTAVAHLAMINLTLAYIAISNLQEI